MIDARKRSTHEDMSPIHAEPSRDNQERPSISNNQSKKHHTYRKIKKVGQGNFGTAFLAQEEHDRKYYIIKVIRNEGSQESKEQILKEIKVMKSLRHQYVIAYKESFLDKNKNICIVMEYAEEGDLASKIAEYRKANRLIDEQQVLEWFIQICFGLKYIHSQKVVHRDLKPENIFLTKLKECKIGDFGIAFVMDQTFDLAKTKIGTPYCMAPEIWENNKYNQKSDMFSLGCILYELCTLRQPFKPTNNSSKSDSFNADFFSVDPASIIMRITEGKYEPIRGNYSSEIKEIVRDLLNKEPQLRPSVNKVLEKEFIKKRISPILSNTLNKYECTLQNNNNKENTDSQGFILSNGVLKRSQQSSVNFSHKRSLSSSITNNLPVAQPDLMGNKEREKLQKLEMELLEYKQNYPIVLEQNRKLKEEMEKEKEEKEQLYSRVQVKCEELRRVLQSHADRIPKQVRLQLQSHVECLL